MVQETGVQSQDKVKPKTQKMLAQSAGAVEYTDCTSAEE